MALDRRTIILGVAASDAHVVANHLIAMRLRAGGFEVVNLGACTTLYEFGDAWQARPWAEAVVIGSLNGHAYQDLLDLPHLRQSGLLGCPVVLGGNLSVGAVKDADAHERLYELGVDRIVADPEDLPPVLDELRAARHRQYDHA